MQVNELLDSRASGLWDLVKKHYDIRLESATGDSFGCYTQGTTAIIYIPKGNNCKDSFAHELLHIFLKSKKVLAANYLLRSYDEDKLLPTIFPRGLIEHIGNCMDHAKMLPLYLNLGFEKEKFILDFNEPKCSTHEITLIKTFLVRGGPVWKVAADCYIGKLIGMKGCPNPSFDYTPFYQDLSRIEDDLFKILEEFWGSWIQFDIETENPLASYYSFCSLLIDQLKKWCRGMV